MVATQLSLDLRPLLCVAVSADADAPERFTRDQARTLGLSTYHGPPCLRKHSGERYVSNGVCLVCMRMLTQRWCAKGARRPSEERGRERIKTAWLAEHHLQTLLPPDGPCATSRGEALARGMMHFFPGIPCSNGHTGAWFAKWNACLECGADRMQTRRIANRELHRARWRRWYAERGHAYKPIRNRKRKEAYHRRGLSPKMVRYLEINRAKILAGKKLSRQTNRHVYLSYARKREAMKKNALPPWADLLEIRAVYAEAARKTAETGVQHEVDHIIPIMGRGVCGIHVSWNLRVITKAENRSKNNRTPPPELWRAFERERMEWSSGTAQTQ